jgi:CBS domain-containing protein
MKASDIMSAPAVAVSAEATIVEAAKFLLKHRISGAPVVNDEGRLAGMVTEGDLFRRTEIGTEPDPRQRSQGSRVHPDTFRRYLKSHGPQVKDIMTTDVVRVFDDTPLSEIAALFDLKKIKRVPVMRQREIVGVVSRSDLLRALVSAADSSNYDYRQCSPGSQC